MLNIEYAYNKYCEERFPLPSEEQLEQLEQRIGITFLDDYRRFILEFNVGCFIEPTVSEIVEGCPSDALKFLSGIKASHPTAELGNELDLSLFENNDPLKILPVGGTSMGGLIILVTEPEGRGTIGLKQAYGGFFYLADGIEEFFDLLDEPLKIE